MVQKLASIGGIGSRIYSGKSAKVVDEMGLIKITAVGSQCRPIYDLFPADHAQGLLKPADATKQLWGQSDFIAKDLDEPPLAHPYLVRDV